MVKIGVYLRKLSQK